MRILRRFVSVPDLKTGDNIQRFYKTVGVSKVSSGFQLQLDNRSIFTPEKQPFILPSNSLALSIASEWHLQDKFIHQHRMPLVRPTQMNLSATALDLCITNLRPVFKSKLVSILKNDSLW
jgi:chaperone required for assembly of F1-ATPase